MFQPFSLAIIRPYHNLRVEKLTAANTNRRILLYKRNHITMYKCSIVHACKVYMLITNLNKVGDSFNFCFLHVNVLWFLPRACISLLIDYTVANWITNCSPHREARRNVNIDPAIYVFFVVILGGYVKCRVPAILSRETAKCRCVMTRCVCCE